MKRFVCLFACLFVFTACAHGAEPVPPENVGPDKAEAAAAQETVDLMQLKADQMKLKIQLLQARRKQVEYEYSANCYKDRRWRDYTTQIEDLTRRLEQYLIGGN